jgi:hypothetical protein
MLKLLEIETTIRQQYDNTTKKMNYNTCNILIKLFVKNASSNSSS